MEKYLKQNIDNMLDAIYSPTGTQAENVESICSAFHLVGEIGAQIGRRQPTS